MNSAINWTHISQDLIIRVLDDELAPAQRLECEAHLSACEICRRKLASLQEFSMRIETAVQATAIPEMDSARHDIQKQIESQGVPSPALPNPGKVMRRFGWGMGIAATLAFAVLMAPRHDLAPQPNGSDASQVSTAAQAAAIEVDGETFMPVPYSNTDLAAAAPHIVQMQVPVSSLADIGIVFEPINSRVSTGPESTGAETEQSVLADVLVGADGQPRGVHVLGFE